MKTLKLMTFAISAIVIVSSCKKEEPTTNNNPTSTPTNVKDHFNDYLEDQHQFFTVNASAPQYIYGNQGTRLYLSGNNFADAQGNPLTGSVDIELVEIYSQVDMVLTNKVTMANQNGNLVPISSGGEFYFEITQNGVPVNVVNPIDVSTASVTTPNFNMELFEGEVDNDGDVIWDTSTDSVAIVQDSTGVLYDFPLGDSLSWINCDYFWDNPSLQTNVSVDVPLGCNAINTTVYIVFENENAVTSLYHFESGSFSTGAYYTLPTGMDVFFVVIRDIDGDLEYAVQSSTISNEHVETIGSFTSIGSMTDLEFALSSYF